MGIGGISMSGLAEILIKEGFKVTGSDMKASNMTDKLSDMGAQHRTDRKQHYRSDRPCRLYSSYPSGQ